uniref:(northern house mosquito) hypothetical protein n=3 Tax=Culex pipiens TaxID=7175 RepID=A0A8D8EUQ1_CULPI
MSEGIRRVGSSSNRGPVRAVPGVLPVRPAGRSVCQGGTGSLPNSYELRGGLAGSHQRARFVLYELPYDGGQVAGLLRSARVGAEDHRRHSGDAGRAGTGRGDLPVQCVLRVLRAVSDDLGRYAALAGTVAGGCVCGDVPGYRAGYCLFGDRAADGVLDRAEHGRVHVAVEHHAECGFVGEFGYVRWHRRRVHLAHRALFQERVRHERATICAGPYQNRQQRLLRHHPNQVCRHHSSSVRQLADLPDLLLPHVPRHRADWGRPRVDPAAGVPELCRAEVGQEGGGRGEDSEWYRICSAGSFGTK